MEMQQVYGVIGPDGQTISGQGFQLRKIRFGLYLVEFERPFAQEPATVCTILGNEWQTFNLSIAILEVTPDYFVCGTSSPDRPEDCGFTFIASGNV
jgi:hypothetical protein